MVALLMYAGVFSARAQNQNERCSFAVTKKDSRICCPRIRCR